MHSEAARPERTRIGGFTLIELLVVISIISLLMSMLLPALGKSRRTAQQLKDGVNIHSIVQSLVMFGNAHEDWYPLPSVLDRNDATMDTPNNTTCGAFTKDNTGNIFSVLVFQNYVVPQILISAAEPNPRIVRDDKYEYRAPSLARVPTAAQWDPGFSGYPGEPGSGGVGQGRRYAGEFGNVSFANLAPFGAKLALWKSTMDSREAVVANRAPKFALTEQGVITLEPGPTGQDSARMKVFGTVNRWAGNVGFNDGHVSFENRPDPVAAPLWSFSRTTGIGSGFDNVFENEQDETGRYLPDFRISEGRNATIQVYGEVYLVAEHIVYTPFRD